MHLITLSYLKKFNTNFAALNFRLSSNTITGGYFYYTPNLCADLYIWLVYNKIIKSNSKFLLNSTNIQIEEEEDDECPNQPENHLP